MGKIAFVFAGQGDQFSGMGKDLYDGYPSARVVFDKFDAIRPGTSDQCFFGSEDALKQTANTQPCLFAYEIAAASVLLDSGIVPDVTAGFSLGEVSAAVQSGMLEATDGFSLVIQRGMLMQAAADEVETAMVAVVKLTAAQVEDICARFDGIYPVNYNCSGQITVAGCASEMPAFSAEVKAAGGRALPLKVKGGFHSPFMKAASERFAEVLENAACKHPKIPLYSNLTARPYEPDRAKALLADQICNPVRWESIIRAMIDSGVDTFIEIGPGKTLSGMIGKIDPNVRRYSTADLDTLLSEVKSC